MLIIAVLTLGILFAVQLVTVVVARYFAYPHRSWIEVAQKPVLALLAEFVAYIVVALYMILLLEGKYHARFWSAIRWNWPGLAGWSFLVVGLLMVGLDVVGTRFLPIPKTTPFDQFFERPIDAYLTALFAITLGPLMEEIFFRGFLYPVIARRLGAVWGVLLTAFLFGLVHSPQYGYSWAAVLIVVHGGCGAHDGAGCYQIRGVKLFGARRLQRDAHGANRSGYGRFPAHGKGWGAAVLIANCFDWRQ